jgi:hypothetical protein
VANLANQPELWGFIGILTTDGTDFHGFKNTPNRFENRFHNSFFIRAPPCHPWFNFGFRVQNSSLFLLGVLAVQKLFIPDLTRTPSSQGGFIGLKEQPPVRLIFTCGRLREVS